MWFGLEDTIPTIDSHVYGTENLVMFYTSMFSMIRTSDANPIDSKPSVFHIVLLYENTSH